MTDHDPNAEQRVLVLAPTAKDAEITRALLCKGGLSCCVCENMDQLIAQIPLGAGVLLLTQEAIIAPGVENLLALLHQQPHWSELPVVMLMRGGVDSPIATRVLASLRNVTVLERPAPMRSVQSVVHAAVKSRLRQYQIRDQIEDIRRAEKERESLLLSERAARMDAERANRIKEEFLAVVSHELRTPLNAILGWTQLLDGGKADAETLAEAADVIQRNAQLQAQLIEDLLDMGRIMNGKIRLEMLSVDPAQVVRSAIESVQTVADAKNIAIETDIATPLFPIRGDAGRLQQVVWNLLSNAVKFTPLQGKIAVTLTSTDTHVEIRITDNGLGMDPAFVSFAFERFRQADPSTTRKHGGLGLGLSIVKQLVELHGGTVDARSPGPGMGSTFTVRLPFITIPLPSDSQPAASASAPQSDPLALTDLTGLKVLVVDDDADARRLLKRLLSECHAEVMTAASGREALTLLDAFSPNVLVSDIGMPGMDGYEFITKVRALHSINEKIPAAAVTAFTRSEDKNKALHAGYQTHVAKPIEPAHLIAVVATLGRKPQNPK